MDPRFLSRAVAVLAALLATSSAFAQIKPDAPPISSPSPTPAYGPPTNRAIMNVLMNDAMGPIMDGTNQLVATMSSPGNEIGSRHRAVLDALAAANASAAVTHCVTSFQDAESAAFAAKVRQQFGALLDELKKQRAAALNAVQKMAQ